MNAVMCIKKNINNYMHAHTLYTSTILVYTHQKKNKQPDEASIDTEETVFCYWLVLYSNISSSEKSNCRLFMAN